MRMGRRRKIEVPTGDTQPQFELGDTAEDIERRRREREEREEERERREKEERDRERMERNIKILIKFQHQPPQKILKNPKKSK